MPDTTDPRVDLHRAFDQAATIVAGVRPEQFRQPTPCAQYDVEVLLGHLVGVGRRVAALGRGEPQAGDPTVHGLAADEWAKAFDEARQAAFASWSDDTILGRQLALPWATLPGVVVAQVYTLELTMHAWDLAAATGQLASLDPTLAEAVLSVAHQMVPADAREGEMPFAAVVPVAGDAPVYARLAGYLGRQPTAA